MQFGSIRKSFAHDSSTMGATGLKNAVEIEIDRLVRKPQIRKSFDENKLNELADSITEHGVLQPIRIRWSDDDNAYVVVAGHRRLEASVIAGRHTIPAVIAEVSEQDASYEQAIENIQREDLKPTERARGFQAIIDAQGISRNELARRLGIGKATVIRSLQLLDLDEATLASLDAGEINESDARRILAQRSAEQQPEEGGRKKKKEKGKREIKMVVDGYTLSIKARKVLDDDRIREALTAAMAKMGESSTEDQHHEDSLGNRHAA